MGRSYHQPESLDAALAVLAEHPGSDVVAGGTDLVVGDRQGKRPLGETLVAIHALDELRGIEETGDGGLRLGGLASHWEIQHHDAIRSRFSALSDGSALVGSPATRMSGTIGGNLANASPAVDTGSPLLVLDASVELASRDGRRTVALADFFQGPGKTARAGNELLTTMLAVIWDVLRASREEWLQTNTRAHASLEAHRRIYDGLARHDAEAARAASAEHIRAVGEGILKLLGGRNG